VDALPSSRAVFKTPSPRELEIAPLLRDRYSDKDIAAMLGMGVGTVQTHMKRMRKKSALHDRRELGEWALRQAQARGVYPMIGDTGPLDSPVP
jgi:DNA-binding NarL/FixJ family response regulator